MNIVLRNLRFVRYDPDDDSETDVRPLTEQEATEFWAFFADSSGDDFADDVLGFAERHTDGQATEVEWDLAFEETD